MKKLIPILIAAALIITSTGFFSQPKENTRVIAISQIVEHPALDITRQGILDELKDRGFCSDNKNIEILYDNAQGDPILALQIAQKFSSIEPSVIVALGTTAAQSIASQTKSIPLIFSSVTNPKDAGLTAKNIRGVSNWIPLEPQLKAFKKLLPKLKSLGIIYNPGEANSVSIVKQLTIEAKHLGIEILTSPADKSMDVPEATAALIGKVDAIFISNDNTALSAFSNIVNTANSASIPVFVSDTDMVDQGALAALGPSQYQIGRQTGAMIANILSGSPDRNQSIEFPDKLEFVINQKVASKLKIYIPEENLKLADKIIQ